MLIQQETMHAKEVIPIDQQQRDNSPPTQSLHRSDRTRRHQDTNMRNRPPPSQEPHIPVLAILLRSTVSTRTPAQFLANHDIPDSLQISIRLHQLSVLHRKRVPAPRPHLHGHRVEQDAREREKEVVELEALRIRPQDQRGGHGA